MLSICKELYLDICIPHDPPSHSWVYTLQKCIRMFTGRQAQEFLVLFVIAPIWK